MDHFRTAQEGTRITLTWLQWELSKRPDLQAHLRKELRTHNPPVLSNQTKQPPDFQKLHALPLLDAITTESLRVHAATQSPQYRVTPPEGCTLEDKYFIPGGVWISTTI